MSEEGRGGCVRILKQGLAYTAWLSVYGSGGRRNSTAELVEHVLRRGEAAGSAVYEKVRKVVEVGRAKGSVTAKGFEGKVEAVGREHVVEVIDGGARLEERRRDKLLRIEVAVEVDGVRCRLVVASGRYGKKKEVVGYARADAPGGREADVERLVAVIKALTGEEPCYGLQQKTSRRL